MSVPPEYRRVSKQTPCPICGRPDWCLVSRDEPPSRAICKRVSNGATHVVGQAGHHHVLRDRNPVWKPPERKISLRLPSDIDFGSMAEAFQRSASEPRVECLSRDLGVTVESLRALGIGWSEKHAAWSFPMTDGRGRIRGIRLRRNTGNKFAVKGSREGLFVPDKGELQRLRLSGVPLLVCEGTTDTAAALDLKFPAIGRTTCSSGYREIVPLLQNLGGNQVVIVTDTDAPGRRGGQSLGTALRAYARDVRIIEPPNGYFLCLKLLRTSGATGESKNRIALTLAQLQHISPRSHGNGASQQLASSRRST